MQPMPSGLRPIANIHESPFTPFVFPDGVRLGDKILQLDATRPKGTAFHIYRMPTGITTRGHRHTGVERFLLLEGTLIDGAGTVFGPGDLLCHDDGTEHNSTTPTGCTLAAFITDEEVTADQDAHPSRLSCAPVGLP